MTCVIHPLLYLWSYLLSVLHSLMIYRSILSDFSFYYMIISYVEIRREEKAVQVMSQFSCLKNKTMFALISYFFHLQTFLGMLLYSSILLFSWFFYVFSKLQRHVYKISTPFPIGQVFISRDPWRSRPIDLMEAWPGKAMDREPISLMESSPTVPPSHLPTLPPQLCQS